MHKKLTLFLTLIIGCTQIIAQHNEATEIKNTMWPANDPYATLTDVPEEWKDVSAVILYQSYHRAYTKKGKHIRNANSLRKRLKIQDQSALEEYSEFVFGDLANDRDKLKKKSDFVIGEIKVIKSDGTSFLINLDEAVEDGNGGQKVAISNLEVGDIIDYYYYQHDAFFDIKGHAFQPVISTLGENYPILHQDLSFTVSSDFYISFNTYNGAPEVKTIRNNEEETITYLIEDHNRPAEDYIQWFYPNRELPTIKFQVFQASKSSELKSMNTFDNFDEGNHMQSVEKDDISFLVERCFTVGQFKDKGLDAIIEKKCTNCTDEEKLKLAYNYLRYDRFVDMYETFSYIEADLDVFVYSYGNTIMHEVDFINTMASYLTNKQFEYEILVTVPRKYGTIDEVLLTDELSFIIKVKNGVNDIYLTQFSTNTGFDMIPYELQGQDALSMTVDPNTHQLELKESATTKIPIRGSDYNQTHGISLVTFDLDNIEKINIKRRSIMTGHNMDFDRADLLTVHDIVHEEEKELDLDSAVSRLHIKKNKVNKFNADLAADKLKAFQDQQDQFEVSTAAEYDFELEEYSNPQLMNTGRWSGPFEYKDEFSSSSLMKKAGKNYVFQIGQLTGKQMALEEEQMEREYPVHMAFARSFKEEIIVEIPDGYEVSGLDRLNVSIENVTGGFTSTATIKDGKLYLNTFKRYSNNYENLSNWPHMIEFLEAAYDLSQEKILLKKVATTAVVGSK